MTGEKPTVQLPSPYLLVEKWLAPMNLYYLEAFLTHNGFDRVTVVNLAGLEHFENALPDGYDYYGLTIYTP